MAIICGGTTADYHLRSSQTMGLTSQSQFSIACWLNSSSWGSAARRSYVGIYGPATDTALGTPVTAVQIGTAAGANTVDCWTWGGNALISAAMPSATWNGVWVHLVYTYDGTNHRLYRNGTLLNTTVTAPTAGFLNQVYINGYPGGGTGEVDAHSVDEYSLYRRTLSADEIVTMYNAQGSRHGIVNDLICTYEFDEGALGSAAATVPDMSGNGHTLTAVGAGAAITYTYSGAVANSNIRPVQ